MKPRLREKYESELRPNLIKQFNYPNNMAVPKVDKIVINMGIGEGATDSKKVAATCDQLTLIAGQKAISTRARKSIANFKLREGVAIGAKVTLRREKMYEFLDRLLNIALPRVRDFRGVSRKSFDGNGNYSMGIKEHIVFPEIDYDKVESIRGLDISIITSAKTDNEACELLKGFGMPFTR